MKKRTSILALFMAIVMCFCSSAINVNAALPEHDGLNALSNGSAQVDLQFSQNVALISYSVESNNPVNDIEIHVLLERRTGNSWTEVKSWTRTVESDHVSGSYTKTVYNTGYYCATLWGYAHRTNGVTEFFSATSFNTCY